MIARRALVLLLLAGAGVPLSAQAPAGAQAPPAPAAAEDARLLAFLDTAFDQQTALSPETMTDLGLKTDYGKLDDYTDAGDAKRLALEEKQLADLHGSFAPARLGHGARLSYRLFERQVETDREQFAFRLYAFPVSTNGSPAGNIPAFLINEHRIDSVADAQAYVARLRDSRRVMAEVAVRMRDQAARGIVPPKLAAGRFQEEGRRARGARRDQVSPDRRRLRRTGRAVPRGLRHPVRRARRDRAAGEGQ